MLTITFEFLNHPQGIYLLLCLSIWINSGKSYRRLLQRCTVKYWRLTSWHPLGGDSSLLLSRPSSSRPLSPWWVWWAGIREEKSKLRKTTAVKIRRFFWLHFLTLTSSTCSSSRTLVSSSVRISMRLTWLKSAKRATRFVRVLMTWLMP